MEGARKQGSGTTYSSPGQVPMTHPDVYFTHLLVVSQTNQGDKITVLLPLKNNFAIAFYIKTIMKQFLTLVFWSTLLNSMGFHVLQDSE